MRLWLLFLAVFLFAPIERAQAVEFPWFAGGGNSLLPEAGDKTMEDYSNLFYRNCFASNTDTNMQDYVSLQCACTAAQIAQILTPDQAAALFDPRNNDPYPYSRLMLLAYAPCMAETLRSAVYDSCISADSARNIRSPVRVCGCIANGMRDFIAESGRSFLPGGTSRGYDPAKGSANPLANVMEVEAFKIQSAYYIRSCLI